LAAWFGIALVLVLNRPELPLLGAAFAGVGWETPLNIVTVGIAFALGFTERLFGSLTDVLTQHAVDRRALAPSAGAATGATAAPEGPKEIGTITINPQTATLHLGGTKQFKATPASVRWSISPTGIGQFDPVTATYTAPTSITQDTVEIELTAASVQDPARSATAKITVTK
jgi:hypothetical protein